MALKFINKLFPVFINPNVFLDATGNRFQVVHVDPYSDKKNNLPDGYRLNLLILDDGLDYGTDSNGNPNESNQLATFDVTVLNTEKTPKKGDFVKLLDFDEEHSYIIDYNLILRFKDFEILSE